MYYIYIDKKTNRIIDVKNKIVEHSDNLIICEVENLPEKYDYLEVLNLRKEIKTWKEIQEDYDGNGEIVAKEVEKSRTYFTCDLVAKFRPQPTLEQIEKLKQLEYEKLVESLIRQKYNLSNELAILRQATTKVDEFKAYNEYAEKCKNQAKSKIYGG